jgi:hypothetical protein
MMKSRKFTGALGAALSILSVLAAAHTCAASLSDEDKCEVSKLKTVASYASCRLKADAAAISKSLTVDYSKCVEKIDSKFPTIETNAEGACNPNGNLVEIRDLTDEYEEMVAFLLSGVTTTTTTTTTTLPPPTGECGDGFIDAGEDCDVGNLNSNTCATEGFFNGTLACNPGCTLDTSGCNATRFEDNGLTVLDHQLNLEWEKKGSQNGAANLADPHDADNTYTWAASGSVQSGTLYSDFLFKLNGVVDHATTTTSLCFAAHCDWRVPTIDELKSITVACGGGGPCVADALFLPTRSGHYWSNSTRASLTTGAYFVEFTTGVAASDLKTASKFARAVRSTN